jgi:anti-sigma-K factor RskA
MTDRTTPLPPDDDDDLLAAEYVLGLLDGPAWRAARDRAETDGAFAARVRDWEGRLAPLNAGFAKVPVPFGQLARIESRLFPAPPRTARNRSGWASWLAGGLTAAALVLGLAVLLPPDPRPPGIVQPATLAAELASEDGTLVFAARLDTVSGGLSIARLSGDEAEAGQDYELWAIDDTGTPRSLGLLRTAQATLDPAQTRGLAAGVVLAVSLEPAGGSPDPVPSGPVLAAAPLAAN